MLFLNVPHKKQDLSIKVDDDIFEYLSTLKISYSSNNGKFYVLVDEKRKDLRYFIRPEVKRHFIYFFDNDSKNFQKENLLTSAEIDKRKEKKEDVVSPVFESEDGSDDSDDLELPPKPILRRTTKFKMFEDTEKTFTFKKDDKGYHIDSFKCGSGSVTLKEFTFLAEIARITEILSDI